MKEAQAKIKRRVHAARINSFRAKLLIWFDTSAREFPWRSCDATPYVQILTEILLQQTRAESVATALPTFLVRYPNWQAIARARVSGLERMLHPLGLWRRRARALKRLAISLRDLGWKWPVERDDLEKLPAVGQYVASAVRIFEHQLREPLLDINMARILERYFGKRILSDIRYDPWLQSIANRVVAEGDVRYVNWAILDFGALICTAKMPRCKMCPLRTGCLYFRDTSPK